jgi:hypothetical protein
VSLGDDGNEVVFQHIYRQANQVVNRLAGHILLLPMDTHVSNNTLPGCINVLWQDCIGVHFSRRVPM